MRDLRALPKAELHLHLEGAIKPATVRELADAHGRPLPGSLQPDDSWRFDGFLHFIDEYGRVCDLLNEPDDFHRVARELCTNLAAEGVRYAEVVFSPAQHARRLGDWYGPIEAVLDGLAVGERETGVVIRLEPDVIRDYGMEQAEGTLEVALKFAGAGVVALNCAGSERFEVAPYADIFRRARDAGLRSAPHAGEWAGPQSVWATLEHLLPDRIGHGVRAIEDPRLIEHLVEREIPLEVCPTSNIATGAIATPIVHPFPKLRDAGVIVTLNSDDPGMFGSWVTDQYELARNTWDLGDEDLADPSRAAVRASFADHDLKREIDRGIDAWLGAE